ncbi:phosphotransferase [Dapis sp. BLCC M126]|uniref:aminoglycoside phosphotransferase family protein n=1 Tax=Dapis sp. BLCC M126 TaxID=3400189 RepID=UPI003CF0F80D
MTFILSSHNIFDYLSENSLANKTEETLSKVEPINAKNFNLLVTFADGSKLLVKQERHNQQGKTIGEFQNEWLFQNFLNKFPQLEPWRLFLPKVVHFDLENSIIVSTYLDNYQNLMNLYRQENSFPEEFATEIGKALATIHRDTFNRQEHQEFLSHRTNHLTNEQVHKFVNNLERITPEIFGIVPADGLKFFALYQRYDSLGQAIAQLSNTFNSCCFTHNDFTLNNILVRTNWQEEKENIVKLIDWERCDWGDPTFDVGTLISSYLQLWLNSLVISKSLTIEESLRLATTPLELLQPSIASFMLTYLHTFPEIVEYFPDFLPRAIQFAGFSLIQQIQAMIQYQKSFGNTGIAMLQVAKTLLCRPQQSIPTIFGSAVTKLSQFSTSLV